jgi:hypothetical protein
MVVFFALKGNVLPPHAHPQMHEVGEHAPKGIFNFPLPTTIKNHKAHFWIVAI